MEDKYQPYLRHSISNPDELHEQIFNPVKGHGIRTVAEGLVRVGMDFQEQAVNAGGNRCFTEGTNEFPLPAGCAARTAGELY
jgi:hypothetical protein